MMEQHRDLGPGRREEQLTAWLLGELPEEQRGEFEAALAADAGLQARRKLLEGTIALVRAGAAEPRLSEERRAALRAAAQGGAAAEMPPPAPQWRLPRLRWAAAALLTGGAIWWLSDFQSRWAPAEAAGAAPELAAQPAGPVERGGASGPAHAALEGKLEVEEAVSRDMEETRLGELGYVDADVAGEQAPASSPTPPQDRLDRFAGAAVIQDQMQPPPAELLPLLNFDTGPGRSGDELQAAVRLGLEVKTIDSGELLRLEDAQARVFQTEEAATGGYRLESAPPASPLPASRESLPTTPTTPSTPSTAATQPQADSFALSRAYAFGEVAPGGGGAESRDDDASDVLLHLQPRRHGGRHESPRDMFFRYYGDHAFVKAEVDPLSTFSIDVDTASYPLVRNYLVQGQLPPKEAVRTEEFVNYFPSGLRAPEEGDFAVRLELVPSLFGGSREGVWLLKAGVKAREVSAGQRKPLNLVFVVDRSGSMAQGNRLELVKQSLELLVDQLREDDTVGLVSFNDTAHHELAPASARERWKIREAVRGLASGGSTNAEAGLVLGYELAERAFRAGAVNRVILCSDGVANTGETDQARILERVRGFRERQIDLTCIGVGMGNHNDVFLEQLADQGDGSCHYVDDYAEAKRVFVEQFTGTLQTVARNVKIQLEFDGEAVARWRQLGYENRALADQDFRNDAVDAGEVGAGQEVVALYELELRDGAAAGPCATLRLRWLPDGGQEAQELESKIGAAAGVARFALADPYLRLSAVAAQYAEVLRRSYWARGDSYELLVEEAERLARDLGERPEVRELRDMILRTRTLVEKLLPPQDELSLLVEEARRLRLIEAECEQLPPERRTVEIEALLRDLRRQNAELEARLQELTTRR